jgi:hypothetical protein
MNTKLKIGLGLLGVIILCLFIGPLRFTEGFKSLRYKSEDIRTPGEYPLTVDKPPLYDTYELKGSNIITSNGSAHNWKEYPVFALGSFKQITNNLRFRKSPDDGTASTGDFSDAIYNTKTVKTNIIEPLPPVDENDGARVGYYRSEPNHLFYSIPTNENILY